MGLVGQDEAAAELRRCLQRVALPVDGLVVDPSRPTTRKMRVVTSRNQQVARVDYESDADASGEALLALSSRVVDAAGRADAIVLSDYRKGVGLGRTDRRGGRRRREGGASRFWWIRKSRCRIATEVRHSSRPISRKRRR